MRHRTFADTRRALERDEASCEALVSSFLDKIDADNQRLNIFSHVDREGALGRARYLDQQRSSGTRFPLAGLIVGIKDVICVRGRAATCASQILQGFTSLFDATVIERLRDAGAVFIGRVNCDEFAMGSSNENSFYGPTRNPLNEELVPGGSSGGAAAAVAAGMCNAALGSDTGGSIRQPAAFCGTVGLKPTYGRVSRYGLVAYASSFDCIGPLTHSVEDAAVMLNVIAGRDENDSTSAPVTVPDYREALTGSVAGVRVGLPKEYFGEGLDDTVRERVEVCVASLKDAGAQVQEVSLPHTEYGVATYYILATAEASSNLARFDGVRYGYRADVEALRAALSEERARLKSELAAARSAQDAERLSLLEQQAEEQDSMLRRLYVRTRTEGFGTEVKRRIMLGTYVLSSGYYDAYYAKAQRVRTLIRQDFDRAFESVDVLLTPATPTPPFSIGTKKDDPLDMYLSDVFTVTANLAGVPGLVLPARPEADDGKPVGVQLLARHFDEALLLQVGDALERQLSA